MGRGVTGGDPYNGDDVCVADRRLGAGLLLIIDNYDSFTFNIVQCLGALDAGLDIRVFRNDETDVPQVRALAPDRIILSPGPCTPRESGVSPDVIREFAGRVPILGVCLGHQCLAAVAGAQIIRAGRLMHGKTSEILHDGRGLFAGLPNPLVAARYHSLIIDPTTLGPGYRVTARTADPPHEIMAIESTRWPVWGVQFHPESYLTPDGPRLLANFLAMR